MHSPWSTRKSSWTGSEWIPAIGLPRLHDLDVHAGVRPVPALALQIDQRRAPRMAEGRRVGDVDDEGLVHRPNIVQRQNAMVVPSRPHADTTELVFDLARQTARARAARTRLARRARVLRRTALAGISRSPSMSSRSARLEQFLGERAPRVAYYSEDRGLVAPPDASDVLIVDPIDGTRPAMAGLESACVAVALAPIGDGHPTMGDVDVGCVVEIKSGDWFLAQRGGGLRSLAPIGPSGLTDSGGCSGGTGSADARSAPRSR